MPLRAVTSTIQTWSRLKSRTTYTLTSTPVPAVLQVMRPLDTSFATALRLILLVLFCVHLHTARDQPFQISLQLYQIPFCLLPNSWLEGVMRILFFFALSMCLHHYNNAVTPLGRSQWPRFLRRIGLRSLACWDCGVESRWGHGCLSLVIVMCCHVAISAKSWSLVQRSPINCCASLCVI